MQAVQTTVAVSVLEVHAVDVTMTTLMKFPSRSAVDVWNKDRDQVSIPIESVHSSAQRSEIPPDYSYLQFNI